MVKDCRAAGVNVMAGMLIIVLYFLHIHRCFLDAVINHMSALESGELPALSSIYPSYPFKVSVLLELVRIYLSFLSHYDV